MHIMSMQAVIETCMATVIFIFNSAYFATNLMESTEQALQKGAGYCPAASRISVKDPRLSHVNLNRYSNIKNLLEGLAGCKKFIKSSERLFQSEGP